MLISIPFSPSYMAKAAQYYWPKGNNQAHFTMTDAAAEAVLNSEGAKLDHHRTYFELPYQSDIASGMHALKEASSDVRIDKSIYPANLTEKEVRRIYAVAMTNGVDHLQGGLLQISTHSLVPWFAYFSQGGLYWDTPLVTLENKNITLTHKVRATEMMGRKADPLVVANYSTEIIDNGDTFTAKAKNKYKFAIDVNLWREEILPRVHARLKDEKPLTALDLFVLTPCLGSHDVMKSFAKRIVQEGSANMAISKELITSCFAEKPKVCQKIMHEIDAQFRMKDKLEADKKSAILAKQTAKAEAKTRASNISLALDVALGLLIVGTMVGLSFVSVGAVPFICATLVCVAIIYTRLAFIWNKRLKDASNDSTRSVMSRLEEGGNKKQNSFEVDNSKKEAMQMKIFAKKDKVKVNVKANTNNIEKNFIPLRKN